MREIANLCAETFHNTPAVINQRIHLDGKRCNLHRQVDINPIGFSLSYYLQRTADTDKWAETKYDDTDIDQNTDKAETQQIPAHCQPEFAELFLELLQISHNAEPRNPVERIKHNITFNNKDFLTMHPPGAVTSHESAVERFLLFIRRYNPPLSQRQRPKTATQTGRHTDNLPIPARCRIGTAYITEIRGTLHCPVRRNADKSDQPVKMRRQQPFKIVFIGILIKESSHPSDDSQGNQNPQGRKRPEMEKKLCFLEQDDPFCPAPSRSLKTITHATDCLDNVNTKLAAQAADKNLNRIGIAVKILSIKMLNQSATRNYLIMMRHQIG